MAMMTVHWLGRDARAAIETASSSEGIDSMTSTMRITSESTQPLKAPARIAERQTARQAEQRGEDTDDQGLAAADDEPRQDVTTRGVGAQGEAGLGPGDRVGLGPHLVEEQSGWRGRAGR